MSKLIITVTAIVLVVLLAVSGVVEVKVNASKFEGAPARIKSVVMDKVATNKVKAWLVNVKRDGEQWLIKDEQKKFELALLYVEQDVEALKQMVDDESFDGEAVVVQAELLEKSVNRVKSVAETVSVEVMAGAKDSSKETFGLVSDMLKQVVELVEDEEELPASVIALKEALVSEEGLFTVKEGEEADEVVEEVEAEAAEVAGTQDEESAVKETKEEQAEIPLVF